MLTCRQVIALLPRYVDDELDAGDARAVEDHIASCASCRAELAAERSVAGVLGDALTSTMPPRGFDDAVMRTVRSTERPTLAGRLAGWVSTFRRQPRRLLPVLATACIVAIITFSFYIANLRNVGWDHDTIILGQSNLASGAPAALRVVTYTDETAPSPDRGVPVSISLRKPNGGWQGLYDGMTNADGTVDAGFRMPSDLNGKCELQVRTGPWYHPEVASRQISVHKRVRLQLATDRPAYDIGDTIHIRALAIDIGSSRPAAGQTIHFEVKDPSGATLDHADAAVSSWGIASTDFGIDDIAAEGQYQIEASCGEDSSTQTVTVERGVNGAPAPTTGSRGPINVTVVPESSPVVSGLPNAFYIVTTYADGTPAATTGTVACGQQIDFKTNALGIGEATVEVDSLPVSMTVDARDSAGRVGDTHATFPAPYLMYVRSEDTVGVHVSAAGDQDGIVVRTDKSVYHAGETIYATIAARRQSGPVYADIAQDGHTVLTSSGEFDNGSSELSIAIPNFVSGVVTLNAYYLNDSRAMVRSVRRVIVEPANPVTISVAAVRDGGSGALSIHAVDQSGHGVACAVGLNVVDGNIPTEFPAGDLRTAVALAALPGPKNFAIDAPASMLRYVNGLDLGDTDYDIRYDSGIQRQIDIPRLQSEYFASLTFLIELLAIVLAALLFMKRSTAALVWWIVVAIPIVLIGFASPWISVTLAVAGLGIAGLSRYTEASILGYAAAAASIAIAAAILFPVFAQAREKARSISALSVLKQLQLQQLEAAQDQEGSSQTTAPDVTTASSGPTVYWNPEVITDGNGNATVPMPLTTSGQALSVSATASTMDGRTGSTSVVLPVGRQAGTPVPR